MERPRFIARFGDFVRQDEVFWEIELQEFLQRIDCGPAISQNDARNVLVALVVRWF
jgi:hypothetical protein